MLACAMSVRENIELYGLADPQHDGQALAEKSGAAKHPGQRNAYVLDGLPFHGPRPAGDHLSILSFNNAPLPDSLIEAIVDHPELFPDGVLIRWTQEQELILEATLGELRGRIAKP